MKEAFAILPCLGLVCAGLSCVRLSQAKGASLRWVRRIGGFILILIAWVALVQGMGVLAGSAAFCGSLSIGILTLAFLESRFPAGTRSLGIAGAMLAGCALLIQQFYSP